MVGLFSLVLGGGNAEAAAIEAIEGGIIGKSASRRSSCRGDAAVEQGTGIE